MEIQKKLLEIWNKNYVNELPEIIKERGFNYSINNEQKDILITGINPSFRKGDENGNVCFDFKIIAKDSKYDTYWTSLKKLVINDEINLINKTACLDIFYFREKDQKFLTKNILTNTSGLTFVAEQLNLTQHIIEDIIKPKVIIVKNKESAAYWGKYAEKGIFWMGYELEFLENTAFGELYKIKGLLNTTHRIAPEIKNTNIENSLILFTVHINQYTKKEKRPTPSFINELLSRN
ncbi:hypothetical protein JE945_002447 [Flavobacterium psychrophilum]|uniref:hypothetical protein n=1 Tax=Flavobacterium psychrophilum TaxID=96345 RepID=UPI000A380622|nr:hypothetical protein [Flavobacterium psychrophilum]EKT3958583.1 hypothetical protein [Flavobacterium psychrophilum]EKT4510939.1 hypothetical protein [Flavobacterium psychrophilum]EKT4553258.1 hypothetical protein [Flavobacterium psychrophilum]OUD23566.1 hypothetical protein FPG92_13025 [Flavobacterium psychrophilum]